MTSSSSSAVEKNNSKEYLTKGILLIAIILISLAFLFLASYGDSEYTRKTLKLEGSLATGDGLFKMNCVSD